MEIIIGAIIAGAFTLAGVLLAHYLSRGRRLKVSVGSTSDDDKKEVSQQESEGESGPSDEVPSEIRLHQTEPIPVKDDLTAAINFVEDLVPSDDAIRKVFRALKEGIAGVVINWPAVHDDLFETACSFRPDLQEVLRGAGVELGRDMDWEISQYDARLEAARLIRQSSARRLVALWKGLEADLHHDYFAIPAIRHFLILANLSALMRLHRIVSRVTNRKIEFDRLDPVDITSDVALIGHQTIRKMWGLDPDEPIWGARLRTTFCPPECRVLGETVYVWGTQRRIQQAYRLSLIGQPVTNGFVHALTVPQVEFSLLYEGVLDEHMHYSETGVKIDRLVDERFKEIDSDFNG